MDDYVVLVELKSVIDEKWSNEKSFKSHYKKHVLNINKEELRNHYEEDLFLNISMDEYLKNAEQLADSEAIRLENASSLKFDSRVYGFCEMQNGQPRFLKVRSGINRRLANGEILQFAEVVVYIRQPEDNGEPTILTYFISENKNNARLKGYLNRPISSMPNSELHPKQTSGKIYYQVVDDKGNIHEEEKEFDSWKEAKSVFNKDKSVVRCEAIKWGTKVVDVIERKDIIPVNEIMTQKYHIEKVIAESDEELTEEQAKWFVSVIGIMKLSILPDEKYYEKVKAYKDLLKSGETEEDIKDFLLDESLKGKFRITEELLHEANRQQLLQKSRNAQLYRDTSKGKNRYERRNKSSISATVRDYNSIEMDGFFKRDILQLKIPVLGETDVYEVDIRVDGLLKEIQHQVMSNKGKLEFKVVLQSLMKVLNTGNVYIGCSCPDAKYRMAYNQTKNGYKAGYRETRPSDKTNPNDTLGAGCKHVMLILANLDWAVKVSSVINNYIKYCKEHLERNYADYIFPKVYGVKYQNAVQLDLFDDGILPSDRQTMDSVINRGMQGKDKQGRFVPGNNMRFQKADTSNNQGVDNANQLQLDLEEPEPEDKTLVPSANEF